MLVSLSFCSRGEKGGGRSSLGQKSQQEQCCPWMFNCLACTGLQELPVLPTGSRTRGASHELDDGNGQRSRVGLQRSRREAWLGTLVLNSFCTAWPGPARMGMADVSLPVLPKAGTRLQDGGCSSTKAPLHWRRDAGKAGEDGAASTRGERQGNTPTTAPPGGQDQGEPSRQDKHQALPLHPELTTSH